MSRMAWLPSTGRPTTDLGACCGCGPSWLARGIDTSVYSSPKAFRSLQSDEFDVLSALAAWAAPYRWPTKSDDPGDAGTETKVVEPTGRTS